MWCSGKYVSWFCSTATRLQMILRATCLLNHNLKGVFRRSKACVVTLWQSKTVNPIAARVKTTQAKNFHRIIQNRNSSGRAPCLAVTAALCGRALARDTLTPPLSSKPLTHVLTPYRKAANLQDGGTCLVGRLPSVHHNFYAIS